MKIKKIVFIAFVAIIGLVKVNAQENSYGITAGYHMLSISVSGGGNTISTNANGYFIGFFGEFNVSEKFNIQPEIHFASAYQDGENANEIIVPIMAKYYVSEEFNVQAGPQLDFIADESEGVNKFGLGLGFGAGYDISKKVFAAIRYSIGLSNRIQDAPSGISSRFDTFQAGIGYRF